MELFPRSIPFMWWMIAMSMDTIEFEKWTRIRFNYSQKRGIMLFIWYMIQFVIGRSQEALSNSIRSTVVLFLINFNIHSIYLIWTYLDYSYILFIKCHFVYFHKLRIFSKQLFSVHSSRWRLQIYTLQMLGND